MLSTQHNRVSSGGVILFTIAFFLVIGIGIIATAQLRQISYNVDNLTDTLVVSRALSDDIINQVLLTRFYSNKFVRTHSQIDQDQFNIEYTRLKVLLYQAEQQLTNTERVEMLHRIVPEVEEYGKSFQIVTALIRKRQTIQSEILDTQEVVIFNKLTALRVHAITLNDTKLFLAFTNAKSAFQTMNLNAVRYLEAGDERYPILFDTAYQDALTGFLAMKDIVEDPAQYQTVMDAITGLETYKNGFQEIRVDYGELKLLFTNKLDILEPEISNIASDISESIEAEYKLQNAFLQAQITRTQIILGVTTMMAALAGFGFGGVTLRRLAERDRAAAELQASRDHLEDVVTERTADLRRVNEQLRLENSERLRAEETLKQYSERLEEMVEHRTQELKDAQELLVRREKLAVLGRMAGSLGHELRNPLGVISNAVYLLNILTESTDPTIHETLGVISDQLRIADQIIHDLLDFSRTRPANRDQVAVAQLYDQVLTRHPPPEAVKVQMDVPEDLPDVYVDSHQIDLVLNNLVTNAFEAMPNGGELHLKAAIQLESLEQAGDGKISLFISDTGSGISPENLTKLFEPLFTTKVRGIGLGLALSKNLVETNGGSIEVESVEGRGTTFTLKLPVMEQNE